MQLVINHLEMRNRSSVQYSRSVHPTRLVTHDCLAAHSAALHGQQLDTCWRHLAAGVDIDRDALAWGARHNGEGLLGGSAVDQLCLLDSNVSDIESRFVPGCLAASTDESRLRIP